MGVACLFALGEAVFVMCRLCRWRWRLAELLMQVPGWARVGGWALDLRLAGRLTFGHLAVDSLAKFVRCARLKKHWLKKFNFHTSLVPDLVRPSTDVQTADVHRPTDESWQTSQESKLVN
jgi:hypothetical protein